MSAKGGPVFTFSLPRGAVRSLAPWSVTPQIIYTIASLNYTLSVSEYVITNVTAQPVTFLYGTNHGCTVVSHMRSCNILTVSRK